MGKLSRRDMEELREACSYDCGYTDTEEVVKDITAQVLEELDSDTTYGDEVGLVDSDRGEEFTTLDDAAVRMALVALEKQIPVKPIILDQLNGDIDYECPMCGKQVMSDAESRNNYCGECGCKFDWSEIDETD